MSALDIPVKVTTSFDAQPGSPGAKTSEFYITLIKGLAGLLLGTGWVTGHDPMIQMAGLAMSLIFGLTYVYSRTKLKLAVLAPAVDSFVTSLEKNSSSYLNPGAKMPDSFAMTPAPADPSPIAPQVADARAAAVAAIEKAETKPAT